MTMYYNDDSNDNDNRTMIDIVKWDKKKISINLLLLFTIWI